MNIPSKAAKGLLVTASAFVALSCGVDQNDESENKVVVGSDRVPATWKNRSIRCDIPNKSKNRRFTEGRLAGREITYKSSLEVDYDSNNWPNEVAASWNALSFINSNDVKLAVIDIRNVDGVPHYHYFSNGTWNSQNQNWSSTKFLGQLGALHKIRLASNGRMGTDTYINDDRIGIGSRRFTYHSYRLHHDSWNTAGGLFKHISGLTPINGGEYNATSFVRGWLSRPNALFNGYYGYSSYDGLYILRKGSSSSSDTVRLTVPTGGAVARSRNLLSPLTLAESWKRIGVNFRDDALMPKGIPGINSWTSYAYSGNSGNAYRPFNDSSWTTAITPKDVEELFYGSTSSSVGGALHDIGIRTRFTSAFGGHVRLDSATNGKWRIFGKTGSGNNDRAYGAYFCLPEYKGGREFAVFLVSKRGTAVASDAIRKIMDSFAPGIRTGSPRPGPDPDQTEPVDPIDPVDPICTDAPAGFVNNQSFQLTHGTNGRYAARIAIDDVTARKSINGVRYEEKFFVKHSDDDLSNIAFNYDPSTGEMQGYRYNISWDPDLTIRFRASWQCDRFKGEFVNGGITESLEFR
ncbi:MAG: hypothetical protein HRU19_20805 [Pseudobacteriovorax sp.]|nr:hypothetical protein [Pseudobacteriovorax sp.]